MPRRKTQTAADAAPYRQQAGRSMLAAPIRAPAKSTALRASAATSKAKPRTDRAAKAGRDELQLQLDAAETRVKELEARLAQVTDRIAWIADRLHSLLEDQD